MDVPGAGLRQSQAAHTGWGRGPGPTCFPPGPQLCPGSCSASPRPLGLPGHLCLWLGRAGGLGAGQQEPVGVWEGERDIQTKTGVGWGCCRGTVRGEGGVKGQVRELPRLPLRGEGSCGVDGAPRDSAGSGATEEGLTSRVGRHLRLPLRFGLRPHGFDPWVGKIPWRRKWQSTPVLLPGKFHEQRSLVGYSPRGRKESDTTERLHFHFHFVTLHREAGWGFGWGRTDS